MSMVERLDPSAHSAAFMIAVFVSHYESEAPDNRGPLQWSMRLLTEFIDQMDYRYALFKFLCKRQEELDGFRNRLAYPKGGGRAAAGEPGNGSQDVPGGDAAVQEVQQVPPDKPGKRGRTGAGGTAGSPAAPRLQLHKPTVQLHKPPG